jgi:retinol dehydrogenase-12
MCNGISEPGFVEKLIMNETFHHDVNPRHILITGGNRGIGYATTFQLMRAGHVVTLTARDKAAGQAAVERLRHENNRADVNVATLDLGSFAAIRRFAAEMETAQPLDAVIHNAGILVPASERRLTIDGIEECLQVHTVGPILLTCLLASRLRRPCRIVLVASSLHAPGTHGKEVGFDFADPNLARGYNPDRAYKNAKLAQLWFALEWERRFGGTGLHIDAVCPGFVPVTAVRSTTGMRRLMLKYALPWMPFATSVVKAARIEAEWALRDPEEPGGRYFDGRKITEPSEDARDDTKAQAFWTLVQTWLGHPIEI